MKNITIFIIAIVSIILFVCLNRKTISEAFSGSNDDAKEKCKETTDELNKIMDESTKELCGEQIINRSINDGFDCRFTNDRFIVYKTNTGSWCDLDQTLDENKRGIEIVNDNTFPTTTQVQPTPIQTPPVISQQLPGLDMSDVYSSPL